MILNYEYTHKRNTVVKRNPNAAVVEERFSPRRERDTADCFCTNTTNYTERTVVCATKHSNDNTYTPRNRIQCDGDGDDSEYTPHRSVV